MMQRHTEAKTFEDGAACPEPFLAKRYRRIEDNRISLQQ